MAVGDTYWEKMAESKATVEVWLSDGRCRRGVIVGTKVNYREDAAHYDVCTIALQAHKEKVEYIRLQHIVSWKEV